MPLRRLVSFTAMGLIFGSRIARADTRELLLADPPPALEDAVRVALSPWDIRIDASKSPLASLGMPEAATAAQTLAKGPVAADAVVWLTESAGNRALWLYDAEQDQVVSRRVQGGPTDDAWAAAVALTLKTVLRSSSVAPIRERLGGRDDPHTGASSVLRIEVRGGLRLWPSARPWFEPRVGLAVGWWPAAFGARVGIVAELEDGIGTAVRADEFLGRFADHTARLGVRARAVLGSGFALEPMLATSLHWTILSGGSIDEGAPVDLSHVNPAIDAGLLFTKEFTRWAFVGLATGASYWMTAQDYRVEGASILDLTRLQVHLGLTLGGMIN